MNADRIFVTILRCSDSLVAFVASALVHVKIVTAWQQETWQFWLAKVLRGCVQLLHFLPFRPEFKPF